jgi:hypothetical protein
MRRALIALSIAMLIVAAVCSYEAHSMTNYSLQLHKCENLQRLAEQHIVNPLMSRWLTRAMGRYPISAQVTVSALNGSTIISYGHYIPVTPLTSSGVLPPSGEVVILGPGACMYTGSNYTITLRLGLWVNAFYAGIIGAALIFAGFAMLIAADKAKDEEEEE